MSFSKQRIARRLALRHRKRKPSWNKRIKGGPAPIGDSTDGFLDALNEQISRANSIFQRFKGAGLPFHHKRKAPAK
jgi:hypothetical protein